MYEICKNEDQKANELVLWGQNDAHMPVAGEALATQVQHNSHSGLPIVLELSHVVFTNPEE